MAQINYPPLNMHFVVHFNRKELMADVNFQSVQGLQVRVDKTDGKDRVYYGNIILKRAYEPSSKLVTWCMDVIKKRQKLPVNLIVKLLNAEHEMLSGWKIEKAMPVAWGVEELHAQESRILIETIELEPQYFYVLDHNGKIIAPSNSE
ncbi:phage tail protein [Winogradskyella forsetii]|uniref:phage tail protein n=1 Tax=Winogradskyella forsetii TaxID=2686077 RepID=UPI0015BD5DC1|nr:phage tail protein [Winogradskyella forsetii]